MSRLKKVEGSKKLTAQGLLLKYPDGVPLKLQEGKVEHILHLANFLNTNGKNWIKELVRGQRNPDARPRELNPDDPHFEVDEDNIQDEDQSEDYVVFPARVIPE